MAITIACLAVYFSQRPLIVTHREKTITIQYPDGTDESDLPPLEEVQKTITETRKELHK